MCNAKRQNLHSRPFPCIIEEGLDILSQSLFIGFRELNSLVSGSRLRGGRGGGGRNVCLFCRPAMKGCGFSVLLKKMGTGGKPKFIYFGKIFIEKSTS
jgi:hypothetical protein